MNFDFSLIPTATLATIMLSLGMELEVRDFTRLLRTPLVGIVGVVGQLLILPAIALALALSLSLTPTTSMGLILLAACPGGATSNMFTRYARGDVALSISMTAISSIAAPLTVPLIVGLGLGLVVHSDAVIQVSVQEMILTLVVTTALPVLVGMLLLHRLPRLAARIRGKLLAFATLLMILLVIGLAVNTSRVQPDVLGMFMRSSLAVVLLMASCAIIMLLVSKTFRFAPKQTRSLVLEVGIQNINLALVVAINFLDKPQFLGPTLVYLPIMLVFGGLVVMWGRRSD